MKKYVFPYGFRLSLENRKIIDFPAVKVGLSQRNSKKEFSFLVLVDSGAEVSLFTRGDAQLLGLNLEKGKRIKIGGISGRPLFAFSHQVNLRIGEEIFKTEVAFSEKNDTPRILGRNPIFSFFFIIFDNKKKNTIFIPSQEKRFEEFIYKGKK